LLPLPLPPLLHLLPLSLLVLGVAIPHALPDHSNEPKKTASKDLQS
jgi:hypothetical protein